MQLNLCVVRLEICTRHHFPLIRPVGHLLPQGEGMKAYPRPTGEGGRRPGEGVSVSGLEK